jgi:two-component system response regulator YesN
MNTILLVDDDDYVINGLLKHIPWKDMGVEVIGTAADGVDGLEKFRTLQPDFVITDIYMPGMDGFQLTNAIHDINPDVPVVILSGYDDLENARRAVSTGIHHFLLKPPSLSQIEFVVLEVLQQLNESQKHDQLLESYLQQQDVVRRSMKEAFFRDLLTTRYRPDELPSKRIAFMGLPETTAVQVLMLSLIRPDLYVRREERDWQLLRFGTGNIIREMLATVLSDHAELSAEVLEYSDQEFVVIYLGSALDDEAVQAVIWKLSHEILSSILQYMRLSALAGLGGVRSGYHKLIDSYLESRNAVETAEMNEWNRVYAYQGAADTESDSGKNVSMDAVRAVHDAIFHKNWQQALELWQQLSRGLSEGNISLPLCKGVCSGLASSLCAALQASESLEEGVGSGLEEPLLQLNRFGSARSLLEWMDEWVARLIAQIRDGQSQGMRSHALVDRVIAEYIERCYHESITLEQIAANLHVNRNYLSQLFKRVTGEPFVTYFNKYRIRKAIELIETGKYMVYEISERVGFQNSTYFSQVFKSITGYSPSEYNR